MDQKYLLNELHRYYKKFGTSPTFRSFAQAAGYPAPITVVKAFGSWNNGLQKAKLPLRQHRYKTAYLLKWLKVFKKTHSRLPKHREIPYGLRQAMMTHFGSIAKAFKGIAVKGDINVSKLPTVKELKVAVDKFMRKNKRNLLLTDIPSTGYKRFHFTMNGGVTQFWSDKFPSNNSFTAYVNYSADDGHKCFSSSELVIDNFLSKHNIPHKKEMNYIHCKKLNPRGNLRCDFFIDNTYVEFAGMYGNKKYEERLLRKKLLAKKAAKRFLILRINDILTNGQLNEERLLSLFIPK